MNAKKQEKSPKTVKIGRINQNSSKLHYWQKLVSFEQRLHALDIIALNGYNILSRVED